MRTAKQWTVLMCMGAALVVLQCTDDDSKDSDDTERNEDSETEPASETDSQDDTDSQESTDSETEDSETTVAATILAELLIPEDFTGVPVMLSVMFFESENTEGMPAAFGDTINSPEIDAGGTYPFSTSQAGLEGDYVMTVVLYCDGGGNGAFPVSGIDWVGQAVETLTLGPGTGEVDAGQMGLIITP
jgi:hypothetical protein